MPDSSPLIGQIIGHYRIVEKLGAGGMGQVYRARDEHLKRDVALKILLPNPECGDDAEKKILQEARSVSALNDPHICTIHEVGEGGGTHCALTRTSRTWSVGSASLSKPWASGSSNVHAEHLQGAVRISSRS
jgi:serine/threonine protein kinase